MSRNDLDVFLFSPVGRNAIQVSCQYLQQPYIARLFDLFNTKNLPRPWTTMDAATYEEGFFRHRLLMKLPALSATFLPSENTSRKVPSS